MDMASSPRPDGSSGRFCSDRCQRAFDDGLAPFLAIEPSKLYSTTWRHVAGPNPGHLPRPMRMGKLGFIINCAGCGREFDSKGLRSCSPACEREARRREELERDLDQYPGGRPEPAAKRRCHECGGTIPNWRKGKRVRKDTLFCGPTCQKRSKRDRAKAEAVA
jgi:hypothetical protein